MADANLAAALKQAKQTKMFFAFIPKGAEGKLIVSKTKTAAKKIADAKKEIGGGAPVTGKCFGEDSVMVFQVAKAVSAALGAALKKVAQRDAGVTIAPEIRVAGDADAEEPEDTGAALPAATAPSAAPAAPGQAAAPAAGVNGAVAAASGSPVGGKVDFGPWIAAKQNGINQTKTLAAKVAATKHELAKGVLGEINSIVAFIKKLPDNPSPEKTDALAASIRQHEGIAAAEDAPDHFAGKVDISQPMLDALQGLRG